MSNILDIKPIIRDLIAENIDSTFKTVYWVSERKDVPKKPYCMLTELVDNITDRTAEWTISQGKKRVEIYKETVITVGIYVDGLDEFDERKEFAYTQCNNLRKMFERSDIQAQFSNFSVMSLTGVRPLNEVVDGGYLFRYEFDMNIGYNELFDYDIATSQYVDADMTCGDKYDKDGLNIKFKVNENGVC